MKLEEYIEWWEMTEELSVVEYEVDDFGVVIEITVYNGFVKEVLP